jgi:FkbM family methyltransferase
MNSHESFGRRVLRKVISSSDKPGLYGSLGRWAGRNGYWRIKNGPRIILDSPNEYIQKTILLHGVYEPDVADAIAMATSPGELFLDIGANIGQHTLLAAYRGVDVIAFEPVPRIANRLKANVSLNNLSARIQVCTSAICAFQGTATIFEAEREDDGSHSLVAGVPANSISSLSVPTTTVDVHLHECGRSLSAMKIDVEGAEARVLDGAIQTLENDRPIVIIETADRLAENIGETAVSVLRRLVDRDYRILRVDEQLHRLIDTPITHVRPQLSNYVGIPIESARMSAFLDSGRTVLACK